MHQRREAEEIAACLQALREYVRGAAFESERRLAREEYFGARRSEQPAEAAEQVAVHGERDLVAGTDAWSTWFLFHRCHSRADRTPVRMFVEQHPDLPERVRRNLLACEDSLSSIFAVVSATAEHLVLHDVEGEPSDYFRVVREDASAWVQPGEMVRATLLRWDDEYWFHGPAERWPETTGDLLERRWHGAALRAALEGDDLEPLGRRCGPFVTRAAWLRARRRRA